MISRPITVASPMRWVIYKKKVWRWFPFINLKVVV